MFKLTTAAAEQVRAAAHQSGLDGLALRLAAFRAADGSISYRMGFDEVKEDDILLTTEGVRVIMEPESVPLLDEAVMDFVELEPGRFQFIFLNPRDSNYVPPQQE